MPEFKFLPADLLPSSHDLLKTVLYFIWRELLVLHTSICPCFRMQTSLVRLMYLYRIYIHICISVHVDTCVNMHMEAISWQQLSPLIILSLIFFWDRVSIKPRACQHGWPGHPGPGRLVSPLPSTGITKHTTALGFLWEYWELCDKHFFSQRFYFIFMIWTCVWICACQCRCLQRPEERIRSPLSCLMWMLGITLGSSGRAARSASFLTEPSLQLLWCNTGWLQTHDPPECASLTFSD